MDPISRLTRTEKLLGGLDIAHSRGLEIGALDKPMLRRGEADIRFVDHADREALRAKYAGDANVNPDDLVEVDAVWGENTLAACFPGQRFDYVIASHVVEHVPDLIGWLSEVADVLNPTGRLILAIPDRRYTFDYLRRETSLSEVIDNHLRKVKRPTPGQIFDAFSNAIDFDHLKAMSPDVDAATQKHFVSRHYALAQASESIQGSYIDAHCSVFTANSLLRLLDSLLDLGLLRFRIDRFHVAPKGSCEMSLILAPLHQLTDTDIAAARSSIGDILATGMDSEGLVLEQESANIQAGSVNPELLALRKALQDMRASTSWRVTSPIRALLRHFK